MAEPPTNLLELTCTDGTIALIRLHELLHIHEDPIQGTIFHMSDGTSYITNQPISYFKTFLRANEFNMRKYDYP